MNAQLVGAAGHRKAADDRVATELLPGLAVSANAGGILVCWWFVMLWWVVGKPSEDSKGFLAVGADAVQTQLGADLQNGLLADDVAFGKFADDARDVLLLDSASPYLRAHVLGRLAVLANEHDSAGEAVQSVARQGVPSIAAVRAHNLDDGVEVVAAGGVDRHPRGLVDDDEVVILVDDANGRRGAGRLMAMQRV